MDALDLSIEDRNKLKAALLSRRLPIDDLIERMKARGWYTVDPVYLNLLAAQASIHAAMSHVAGLPPTVRPAKEERRPWERGAGSAR